MKKEHFFLYGIIVTILFAFPFVSFASIVINGTRIIYPSDAKEVTIKLNNTGSSPVLIQSWVDAGDINAKPESINTPFVLTPPINRVEPDRGQTLRLRYMSENFPKDKESIYWLNVLEIPAKKTLAGNENYIKMAFRTRIKIFFRPTNLTGHANDAAKELIWSSVSGGLKATNPTPYYISLVEIKINGKTVEADMVPPKSSILIKGVKASSGNLLESEFVNDYGALDVIKSTVK
ncbi:fimbria/pilus periplasmic chaperone [Klebsiella huaxiensis]|uniref:fimbrial biogenesis chaperone n=1 Tax=Klebsiella huaxiensis TaxID=2153354 RepID=UPI002F2CFEF2